MFNKFLTSQIAILIEDINFQNLKFIFIVSNTKKTSNYEWEEISEASKSNALSDSIIVIGVEPLKIT